MMLLKKMTNNHDFNYSIIDHDYSSETIKFLRRKHPYNHFEISQKITII